jgi:acyl-CoA reductase-like NAD-dependent aldehyde dehydrogenase
VTLADTEMMERATHFAATVGREKMRSLLPYQRQEILFRVVQQLKERREELAYMITLEVGKTITDALLEVDRCIQTFQLSGEETTRITGTTMDYQYTPQMTGVTAYTKRYPIGPISCITPFNFPLNLVAHKIAPAIATGCSFVLKPANTTPLSALLLGELLTSTNNPNMPKEGFSIVPCHLDVGHTLIQDDRYKLVTFTGSSDVGFRHIKPNAGKKPVILECGGTAYCIVHDIQHIATIDTVIHDITVGAFYQSGQSCISIQHLLIHESIYDIIKEALIEKSKQLVVGNPYDPNTHIGPVISEESAIRIEEWIDEAVTLGATIVSGTGKRYHHNCIAPTILENVPHQCRLYQEEVFGPVVCIEKYSSFYDAVALVNASKYGLQTGIYTNNHQYIQYAFDEIDCGGICINTPPSTRVDAQPYGGLKDSGIGREGIQYTMENYTK